MIQKLFSIMCLGERLDRCVVPGEFMNCKKSHEVRAMSEVVNGLAKFCKVKQVRKCKKEEKCDYDTKHLSYFIFLSFRL